MAVDPVCKREVDEKTAPGGKPRTTDLRPFDGEFTAEPWHWAPCGVVDRDSTLWSIIHD